MTELVFAIDFTRSGNSSRYVLDGWSHPEQEHRWTMGRGSRLVLPPAGFGPDCVLAVTATPCRDPPHLEGQAVMLALNGRLLATIHIAELQVLTFRWPAGLDGARDAVLSFTHLSCGQARAPSQMRGGQPLGLMMHSLRVFRLDSPDVPPLTRGAVSGEWGQPAAGRGAWVGLADLAGRFESIGQGCQFGLVQRACGIEPLGLLRFVDTVTAKLVDALVADFAGVDDPARLRLHLTADAEPRVRWEQTDYKLLYDTRLVAAGADPGRVRDGQARRLGFLRRKFLEELGCAEKIFVLTRGHCLTETEALAVYCALRLRGANVLLWTVFGDRERAGQVDRLRAGFLRGHLGDVDQHGYGSQDAWLSVMSNAVALA